MTKVLVVEDDPINRELVIEIVKSVGFTVDVAETGEDAVKKTEKGAYDLILMDIELPCMDGVAAAEIMKSKPGYENTPVIALTAFAMKGDRERFLAQGFNDYFPKPIIVADFLKLLNKYRK